MRWVRGWFASNSKSEMKAQAVPMYEKHYALVRNLTPPERLLEYRLGSGWEPLCEFLGKPVPINVPFPSANDQKSLQETTGLINQKSMLRLLTGRKLLVVVLPVTFAALAWTLYSKHSA